LSDYGEFALLQNVVFPALAGTNGPVELGDDCGIIPLPHNVDNLVVTTDVSPVPLAFSLGHKSYETYGWYAVTVNVSDLAAGGAEPFAFSTSVEAPPDMLVKDFKAFFDGVASACRFYNIWASGGNIRSAPRFECHGTAIGISRHFHPFKRQGIREGDILLSIGNHGVFMAAALLVASKLYTIDSLSKNFRDSLLRPIAKIREAQIIGETGGVRGATDSSDGLLMALFLLASRSKIDIEVEIDDSKIENSIKKVADNLKCDPWNLIMAWGEYQLVVAVDPAFIDTVKAKLDLINSPYMLLGTARTGNGNVWARHGTSIKKFRRLGNENFTPSSYNDVPVEEILRGIANDDLYE